MRALKVGARPGRTPTEPTTTSLSLQIPLAMMDALNRLRHRTGLTVTAHVRAAIEAYLARVEQDENSGQNGST